MFAESKYTLLKTLIALKTMKNNNKNNERCQKSGDGIASALLHIQQCVVLIGCPAGQRRVHMSGETMSKQHTTCARTHTHTWFQTQLPCAWLCPLSLSFTCSLCLPDPKIDELHKGSGWPCGQQGWQKAKGASCHLTKHIQEQSTRQLH